MNKDHRGLSVSERFNLVLSDQAVERELSKIKKPVVNVEPLPSQAVPNSEAVAAAGALTHQI